MMREGVEIRYDGGNRKVLANTHIYYPSSMIKINLQPSRNVTNVEIDPRVPPRKAIEPAVWSRT